MGKPAMSAIDLRATQHTRSRYNLMAPLDDLMEGTIESRRYREWRRMLWREATGPRLLELGVGTGKNIPFYPSGARVTAIDLSENMLAFARKVGALHPEKQLELRAMDAQQLVFPDQRFDEVVATFVFCSVPDPVLGLQEAWRVTRPGGRLLLLEHMLAEPPALARIMRCLDPVIHWLTGVHIARRTVHNVETAGWVIDSISPLSRAAMFRLIAAHKE